jgi:hypothetical protein
MFGIYGIANVETWSVTSKDTDHILASTTRHSGTDLNNWKPQPGGFVLQKKK